MPKMTLTLEFDGLYDLDCVVTLYNLLTKFNPREPDNYAPSGSELDSFDIILDEMREAYPAYARAKKDYDGGQFNYEIVHKSTISPPLPVGEEADKKAFDNLGFKPWLYNRLVRKGINTLSKLVGIVLEDPELKLFSVNGCGKMGKRIILETMKKAGYLPA